MKMYEEVDIQPIFTQDRGEWFEGYIYIANYKTKYIVVEENSEQLLYVNKCRLTFKPYKGERIRVRHYEGNPWEYREFLMFHNDKYICKSNTDSNSYYSWRFGKGEVD